MEETLTTLILIGGLVGLPIATYFTLSFYLGDRSAFLNRFARVCRTDHGTCLLVIRTPYARVFKLPNSVFGLVYYSGLIAVTSLGFLTGEGLVLPTAIVVAWVSAAFSMYLTWALLHKLKAP